jgi:hypothetical protein
MKDFWQDIWNYLGDNKPNISCNFIANMWDISLYLEGNIKNVDCDLLTPSWAKSRIGLKSPPDIYLFLCEICEQIAFKTNKKLPENLHARIVLGIQNKHTKEYIKKWGV